MNSFAHLPEGTLEIETATGYSSRGIYKTLVKKAAHFAWVWWSYAVSYQNHWGSETSVVLSKHSFPKEREELQAPKSFSSSDLTWAKG